MTFCPITYNAHVFTVQLDRLIQDVKDGKQNTLLTFVDNLNDLWQIKYVQDRLPNVTIYARCWHPDDYRFHEVGHDSGWVMSPTTFLNFFGHLGTEGRILYAMNEPHGYVNIPRLVDWLIELVKLARARGIRICITNFGTGHPASHEGKDIEWHREYDRLLRLITSVEYRDWVIVGLHEYGPGDGYRLGRFEQLLEACRRMHIKFPQVFISEWGIDTEFAGDPRNGWRTRPITDEEHEYWEYLLEKYNRFYKKWVQAGVIVGLAIFSYGDSGGWGNYRVDNARTFIALLNSQGPKESVTVAGWQDFDWGDEVPNQEVQLTATEINIRDEPNANSRDAGDLKGGEVVTRWSKALEKDNALNPDKRWKWFKLNIPGIGIKYAAEVGGLQFKTVTPTEPPPTDPPGDFPDNVTEADNLRLIFKGIEVAADDGIRAMQSLKEYTGKAISWLDGWMDRNGDPD